MYDPLELARQTAKIVCQGTARKYYRFRPARFYGGIATADCLGCNLRCAFCWAWGQLHQVHKLGQFYEPPEVAERLVTIARKKGFVQVRLSGNEPTLGMPHLLEVLSHLPKDLAFILETNGIILGAEAQWAKELAPFPQVFARVSLKGCTPEEFSHLTGAVPEGFALQLKALEHLLAAEVDCHAAVMVSFSPAESREKLRQRLAAIHPTLGDFEPEELILYPAVTARLTKRGLSYYSGHFPTVCQLTRFDARDVFCKGLTKMDETPEKKVAISKVDDGKYLAQCRLCGTWIEVHPVIGQDMTIKFWEADFTCCETKQDALFFTI